MEQSQFTEITFEKSGHLGGGMKKGEAAINCKPLKASYQFTFNMEDSVTIKKGGYTHARLYKDNFTGELNIVLNKEGIGMRLKSTGSGLRSNVCIRNKKFILYLRETLSIDSEEKRTIISIGKDLSNKNTMMTFRLKLLSK